LKLQTDGRVPGDISNDLVLLTQIDTLQKEASGLESLQPLFGAHWMGIETETGEVKKWTILANDLRAQIEGMANGAGAQSSRDKVREFLDERFANSKFSLPPVVNCQSLQAAWGQVEMLLPKMEQLSGHSFLLTGTNWLDEILAVISRWKANVGRANTWMNWKSISAQAGIIGLVSVVDAVENNRSIGLKSLGRQKLPMIVGGSIEW
jgi:hypothetical protein